MRSPNPASRPTSSTNRSAAAAATSPSETIVTIDPVDARDFDDAISLERLDNGHWLLGVHIADVSHFVQPKTPLDREAHDRATSVYLPDRVIPMLPEIISNNLASLQPDKVRYAALGDDGIDAPRASAWRPTCSRARSRAGGGSRTRKSTSTWRKIRRRAWQARKLARQRSSRSTHCLGRMHELAMILRARRFARGALELSMPEMKIDLDADGRVTGAHLAKNTESHQIIEEFMLSANEAVAEKLADAGLLFLRRVHGSPDPRKLQGADRVRPRAGLRGRQAWKTASSCRSCSTR